MANEQYKDAVLKRCPFCGFKPDATDEDCISPILNGFTDDEIPEEVFVWELVCPEPAGGCGAAVFGRSPEDAIELWNIRFNAI